MTLAQRGGHDEVVAAAHAVLEDPDVRGRDRVSMLYALATAQMFAGRWDAALAAATECDRAAASIDSVGWRSNALAMRAMIRQRRDEPAECLDDIIEAEMLLESCDDPGLRNWTHSGLGTGYAAMRLFELALPHFEAALMIPTQAVDYADGTIVDYFNLADLHLRWASELERVGLEDPLREKEHRSHLDQALSWVTQGRRLTDTSPPSTWPAAFDRMGAQVRSSTDPRAAIDELTELRESCRRSGASDDEIQATVHLARAHRLLGCHDAALVSAQEAVRLVAGQPAAEPTTSLDTYHQLHLVQLAAGLPGSAGVDPYVRTCTELLWDQRTRTVEGVRARRDYAVLQLMHAESSRLAREDALTGVGNRRALDEWLLAHPQGPATLIMVDLDDFKEVNDTHGHVVGDVVLIRVATALREAAREDDLLVRFGGDEFIVAMPGQVPELPDICARVRQAVSNLEFGDVADELRVRVSVGSASISEGSTAALLDIADATMFAAKRVEAGYA